MRSGLVQWQLREGLGFFFLPQSTADFIRLHPALAQALCQGHDRKDLGLS